MPNPIIDEFGDKRWFNKQGQLHRTDGPAYEGVDGSNAWYLNGLLHREDGPACEEANGYKSWWLNDKKYTEEEFALLQFMNGVNIYADNC